MDAAPTPCSPARAAIVTGYLDEPRPVLERCLRSVRTQSVAADHLVVADGRPQDWLDAAGVRHIRLDRTHGDYGNTPRGVGALLAVAEDYEMIGFLDADNWLEPHHLRLAAATARASPRPLDFLIARTHLRRPDGSILAHEGQPIAEHVDTNCFVFLEGAFHVIQRFALMPRRLASIGDRVFYRFLNTQALTCAIMPEKTVNYHCLWASIYAALGEPPPPGAKPDINPAPIDAWLAGLSARQRVCLERRTGLTWG